MMFSRAGGRLLGSLFLCAAGLVLPQAAPAHTSHATAERLPKIGQAPGFDLATEKGSRLSLAELRGKVVVVTFIFTSCADICPILTNKMVGIQKALGASFGADVYFLSITVDPRTDRPDVLKAYAHNIGADPAGWSFMTGTDAEIRKVATGYGVYIGGRAIGDVDHNLLTTIIDRSGIMRVQYLGQRFDPDEFLHDLQKLIRENPGR